MTEPIPRGDQFNLVYRDGDGKEREYILNGRNGETYADAVVREAYKRLENEGEYLIAIQDENGENIL